ncbi:MAG: GNAT family N-acetyltransferase [Thermoplasmata archaeon]|nr:MAG: GNAT family N-acetyltransferase [Thermoplasmata archaeon]
MAPSGARGGTTDRPRDLRIRVDDDTELRLQREEDAREYLDLIDGDRDRLRAFMEWVDHVTRIEDELAFLADRVEEYDQGRGVPFAVWHRGRIIGATGTVTMDRANDAAEIGYFVAGEFEGRGIMAKAVRTFVDHMFGAEDMNRLSARILTDNHRSLALIERLGFTREGVHRQEYKLRGVHRDLVVYSLLRSEWESGMG